MALNAVNARVGTNCFANHPHTSRTSAYSYLLLRLGNSTNFAFRISGVILSSLAASDFQASKCGIIRVMEIEGAPHLVACYRLSMASSRRGSEVSTVVSGVTCVLQRLGHSIAKYPELYWNSRVGLRLLAPADRCGLLYHPNRFPSCPIRDYSLIRRTILLSVELINTTLLPCFSWRCWVPVVFY